MPNTTVRAAAEGLPQITRRSLIKSTAAVGAACAVTAGAAKEAAAARPSGLGEVTAAFEAARLAFHAAIDREQPLDVLWSDMERKNPILSPKIGNGYHELRGRDADEVAEELERLILAHGQKMRTQLANIALSTSCYTVDGAALDAVAAWEVRALAEAQIKVGEWQARRDACGPTAAAEELQATMDAEQDAMLAVLAYRPVSAPDARAKVMWVLERQSRHEISGLHGAFEALLESSLPEGEELHEQENGDWTVEAGEMAS